MDIATIVEKVLSYGPLGIYAVIITYAYFKKDDALQVEKNSRISDAKDFTKTAMELQSKVIDATNKVFDILDELKKQRESRGNQ